VFEGRATKLCDLRKLKCLFVFVIFIIFGMWGGMRWSGHTNFVT
jgi:hypothetical protein